MAAQDPLQITLSHASAAEAIGLLDAMPSTPRSVQRMSAARLRHIGLPSSAARSRLAFDECVAQGRLRIDSDESARAVISPHPSGQVFRVAVGVTGDSVDEGWSAFEQRYHWFGKEPRSVTSGAHLFVLAVGRWRSAVVGLYETVSGGAQRLPDSPDPERWPWAVGVRPLAAIPPPGAERVGGQTGPQSGLPERISDATARERLYASVAGSPPPPGPQDPEQWVQELEPRDVADDLLRAVASLGTGARRRAVLDRAIEIGGWTQEELAARAWYTGGGVRSHIEQILARALDHELLVMTRQVTRAHGSSPYVLAPEVALPLGQPYRPAALRRTLTDDERAHLVDIAELERATLRHMRLQDRLAAAVGELGLEPRTPDAPEPPYDLAFLHGDTVFVVEVKSGDPVTPQQMRIGVGQVLEYCDRISAARPLGAVKVRPVLLLEGMPPAPWPKLSRKLGISLIDVAALEDSLSHLLASVEDASERPSVAP